jgi:hypothetical protein
MKGGVTGWQQGEEDRYAMTHLRNRRILALPLGVAGCGAWELKQAPLPHGGGGGEERGGQLLRNLKEIRMAQIHQRTL